MSRRGRPLGFDRDIALQHAMEVFWEKGYEGAQLVDLTAAMGINPPSFYAAFGSKRAAFCEALELYVDTVGARSMRALDRAPTARDGLRAMLAASIAVATSTRAGGCLLVLGVVNHQPENDEVWSCLKAKRDQTLARIRARLGKGVTDNDLPRNTDVKTLAAYFLGVTQAISFQARDGASRAALKRLIEPALAALPQRPDGNGGSSSANPRTRPGAQRGGRAGGTCGSAVTRALADGHAVAGGQERSGGVPGVQRLAAVTAVGAG